MADAWGLKPLARKSVRVRLPPPTPALRISILLGVQILKHGGASAVWATQGVVHHGARQGRGAVVNARTGVSRLSTPLRCGQACCPRRARVDRVHRAHYRRCKCSAVSAWPRSYTPVFSKKACLWSPFSGFGLVHPASTIPLAIRILRSTWLLLPAAASEASICGDSLSASSTTSHGRHP